MTRNRRDLAAFFLPCKVKVFVYLGGGMFLFTGLWFHLAPRTFQGMKKKDAAAPFSWHVSQELLNYCGSGRAEAGGVRNLTGRGGAGRVEPGWICRFSSLTGIRKIGRAILTRPDSREVTRRLNKTRFFSCEACF